MESQVKTKENYDRMAQKLTSLKIGDSVHVQRDKLWEPAMVISQYKEHSYNVQTPQGGIYRRFLNKTPPETFHLPEPPVQPVEKRQTKSQVSSSDTPSTNPNAPQEPQNAAIKSPAKVLGSSTISRRLHISKLDEVGR